ncbi:MAG: phospholipase D family protein, partial [Proteobacteria bacterium]|nr:phospholipase D family protein [Pseudomonadota bacterium]
DGSFAVFGGRNVADSYFMNDPQANFLDLDLLAAGPVVAELAAVFDRFWNSALAYPVEGLLVAAAAEAAAGPGEALPASAPLPDDAAGRAAAFDAALRSGTVRLGDRQQDWFGRPGMLRQFATGRIALDGGSAQVWADSPEKVRRGAAAGPTVAAQTLALLAGARSAALILSPYFIPGADGVQAMRRLVQERGVTVTLLTNSFGATDEPLAYAGYGRYRLELLRAGARIHELSPTLARDSGRVAYFGDNTIGRLHTKAMAIDRRRLFVGSLNLDPRSAFSNTEIGVVIDSPKLAQQLIGVYRHAAAGGAFTLRLADDGTRIEWVATDWQGHEIVHADEPHDDPWLRLKLRLLQPWVPEELL